MTAAQRKQNRIKKAYLYAMERLDLSVKAADQHEFAYSIFNEGVAFGERISEQRVEFYRKRLGSFIRRNKFADKALALAALEDG